MATTVTVGSNYQGQVAGEIMGAAFKEGSTLSLGVLTEAYGVGYKFNLQKLVYADGTVDYACGFTPEGAVTYSEKVIVPKKSNEPFTDL